MPAVFHTKTIQEILDPVAQQVRENEREKNVWGCFAGVSLPVITLRERDPEMVVRGFSAGWSRLEMQHARAE